MPFLEPGQTQRAGLNPRVDNEDDLKGKISPLFFDEVLPAAYRQEHTVGSSLEYLGHTMAPANPLSDVVPTDQFEQAIAGFEDYSASFIDARTYADFGRIKRRITKQLGERKVLDDAGLAGFGAVGLVTVTDPINMLPGGFVLKAATRGGRIAKLAGSTAAAGAASTSVAELIFQGTQDVRTYEESALNIAAASILSGILGAGAGYLKEAARGRNLAEYEAQLNKGIAEELNADVHPADTEIATIDAPRSTGAAQVRDTTLEQETLTDALGLEKAISWQDPVLRTHSSPFLSARQTLPELVETPLTTKANEEGIANPVAVESMIRSYQANLNQGLVATDDLFVQYRKGRSRRPGDVPALGVTDLVTKSGKLTRKEFYEEVGRAMRRKDAHEIPEVAAAAQQMRKTVFDPLKERAIELGLLDEDVVAKGADSYLTRVYSVEQIIAQRPEFEKRIVRWLQEEQTRSTETLAKRETRLAAEEARLERLDGDLPTARETAAKSKADYKVSRTGKDKAERDAIAARKRVRDLQSQIREAEKRAETLTTKGRATEANSQANRLKKRLPIEQEKLAKAEAKLEDLTVARGNNYRKFLRDQQKLKDLELEVSKLGKSIRQLTTKIDDDRLFPGMSKEELEAVAGEITDKIVGSNQGRNSYEAFQLTRGPLKERTLGIPDEKIEDFLEDDIELVSRLYTRSMAPDVELTARFGDTEMTAQIDKIKDEAKVLRKKPENAGEKAQNKIDKAERAAVRDIQAMRDRLRNTYALPKTSDGLAMYRVGRTVKTLNYVRLLGGMTLSAFPDLARAVMVHGLSKTLKHGLAPMVKNFKQAKLAMGETKLAGTALDMMLDTRAMQIADVFDDFGRNSKFERGVERLSQQFGVVSLMAPWNAGLKQFVGMISQTRTLKAVDQLMDGTISKADRTRLSQMGISEDLAERISTQFKRHGNDTDGVLWANTNDWTDLEAATAYRTALAREVDKTIVSPGQEKPLWLSKPLGSVVGQFKTFGISSSQRVLLSGLQRKDAALVQGMAFMVGLGMMSTLMKNRLAGRENGDTAGWWVKEGFDRSGVTGWFFDAHNITEKLTRGALGLSQFTDGPTMSRYQSRNAVGAVLGPTFGAASDLFQAVGAASGALNPSDDKEWTESDTKAMRRLLPYQNLFYLRNVLDEFEEGVNEAIGAKK